ncbi:hypothetical protein [Jeotgalibaca porci]|uniref:hypothetical protein n=1 Tax=Jeotgalibaca porci TaxID=1868793 RepID=UPI00359F52FB
MRYKEFKEEVEKLGLKIIDRWGCFYIVTTGGITEWLIASVSTESPCAINTDHYGPMIKEETFRQLFHILVKFAQTSIEERHYEEVD